MHLSVDTSRPLDRPAADIACVCRFLEVRASSLRRLLNAHRFESTIQGQLSKAITHLKAAAESLELVSSSAPTIEEDSRASVRGAVSHILKQIGLEEGGLADTDSTEALTGSNATVPVPDILSFLSTFRRTGVLWVDTLEEAFQIELQDGVVTYSSSDNPPQGNRIGEVLVQMGVMTSAQLYEYLQKYAKPGEMFGATLLREGIVSRQQLADALSQQAQGIFRRLFSSDVATYHFAPGLQLAADSELRGNVTHLLLGVAKEMDEQNRDSADG